MLKKWKKISLNISPEVHKELSELADAGKIHSVSEFIRRGIALQRFMIEAEQRGEKLVVTDDGGRILREVIFIR